MNSSSSIVMMASWVVTSEATGDGTVRDAGENGKGTDDHLGSTNVGRVGSSANSMARRLASPYHKPKGSSSAASSTGTAVAAVGPRVRDDAGVADEEESWNDELSGRNRQMRISRVTRRYEATTCINEALPEEKKRGSNC
ncbi:hypothetical protein Tco_0138898 [Tanacetum coccineum]